MVKYYKEECGCSAGPNLEDHSVCEIHSKPLPCGCFYLQICDEHGGKEWRKMNEEFQEYAKRINAIFSDVKCIIESDEIKDFPIDKNGNKIIKVQ